MDWRFRVGIVSSWLMLAQLWAYAVAPAGQQNTMTVIICDRVGFDPDALMVSERTATHVFQKAGIQLTWMKECARLPAQAIYSVVILTWRPAAGSTSPYAMGFAPVRTREQRRAYIFLDRVQIFLQCVAPNDVRPSTVGTAVGLAIAHELGHLLIPGDAHVRRGIMNPAWSD